MNCARTGFRYPVCILMFLVSSACLAQRAKNETIVAGETLLKEIASLPKHIREASGLEMTPSGNLWTHNDGGLPVLYCVDTTGSVTRAVQLNHPNSGWEDLAMDREGNMYIGAFGNNKNDKQNLKIYKIHNPDSLNGVVNAEIIRYRYRDQNAYPPIPPQRNFDMDAFVAFDDSLFLFSKNRTEPFTGYTRIYGLSQEPGDQVAAPVDSIYLGDGPMMDFWITGADLSPDAKTLALLSHRYVWIITEFNDHKFSSGRIVRINLSHFSHKAGICFASESKIYIVDELEMGVIGGKLYSLDVRELTPAQ